MRLTALAEAELARRQARATRGRPVSEARPLFLDQRRQAARRGIAWQLTFDEWLSIWLESGKWNQRGCGLGQYVMARFGDRGPYAADNVKIVTSSENAREARGAAL